MRIVVKISDQDLLSAMGHQREGVIRRAIDRATRGMVNVRVLRPEDGITLRRRATGGFFVEVEADAGLQEEHREEWATR